MAFETIVNITKILDGIFISDRLVSTNIDIITKFKISHILNVSNYQTLMNFENIGITYLNLNWLENPPENISYFSNETIKNILSFFDDAKNNGEGLLGYSYKGQNRICVIIILYLMKNYNWSLKKSMVFLKKKKNNMNINEYYINELIKFEENLIKENNIQMTINFTMKNLKDNDELLMRNTYINELEIPKFTINSSLVKKNKTARHLAWGDNKKYMNQMAQKGLVHYNIDKDLFLQKNIEDVTAHLNKKPIKACIKSYNNSQKTKKLFLGMNIKKEEISKNEHNEKNANENGLNSIIGVLIKKGSDINTLNNYLKKKRGMKNMDSLKNLEYIKNIRHINLNKKPNLKEEKGKEKEKEKGKGKEKGVEKEKEKEINKIESENISPKINKYNESIDKNIIKEKYISNTKNIETINKNKTKILMNNLPEKNVRYPLYLQNTINTIKYKPNKFLTPTANYSNTIPRICINQNTINKNFSNTQTRYFVRPNININEVIKTKLYENYLSKNKKNCLVNNYITEQNTKNKYNQDAKNSIDFNLIKTYSSNVFNNKLNNKNNKRTNYKITSYSSSYSKKMHQRPTTSTNNNNHNIQIEFSKKRLSSASVHKTQKFGFNVKKENNNSRVISPWIKNNNIHRVNIRNNNNIIPLTKKY